MTANISDPSTFPYKNCPCCHDKRWFLMSFEDDDGNGDADVYVDEDFLIVDVNGKTGVHINYCPKCGRKLRNTF